jgi:predicted neuraminidase
MKSLKY